MDTYNGATLSFEMITPEQAQTLLDTMQGNRRLSPRTVGRYARDMANGNWVLSDCAIAIGKDGNLLNGQHRLNAVVECGEPQIFMVLHNAPQDTVCDRGMLRSTADALRMRGMLSEYITSNHMVSIAVAYIAESKRPVALDYRATDDEVAETLDNIGGYIATANEISSHGGGSRVGKKVACQIALTAALLAGVPVEILDDFCQHVNNETLPTGASTSPSVLRAALRNYNAASSKVRNHNYCMMTEMAIQDYVKGNMKRRSYRVFKHIYFKEEGLIEKKQSLCGGALLKELRERANLSLTELSELSGFSTSFISKTERGVTKMSIKSATAFADIFDIDYHLFGPLEHAGKPREISPVQQASPAWRIKDRRNKLNLTQTQLGALSGVEGSYIARIERGERFVSRDIAEKLSSPLQMTPDEILFGVKNT